MLIKAMKNNKVEKIDRTWWGWEEVLKEMAKESLSRKVACEQRHEGRKEVSNVDMWERVLQIKEIEGAKVQIQEQKGYTWVTAKKVTVAGIV